MGANQSERQKCINAILEHDKNNQQSLEFLQSLSMTELRDLLEEE
jgi:hypothetical protein